MPEAVDHGCERIKLLADYLPWAEAIPMPTTPPITPHCRDPDDIPFLQLAITAKTDALVTGDAHLLDLAPLPGLIILKSVQALATLEARPRASAQKRTGRLLTNLILGVS